jgi:hypothetical protein
MSESSDTFHALQALAPLTSGRKLRGVMHGLVFGFTQISLFETWGEEVAGLRSHENGERCLDW